MMKKICALLLVACLGLALFGCGKDTPTALKPGSYTGNGTGHGGTIEVRITVDNEGRITDIKILNEQETPDYAAQALELLPRTIVEKQSLGLDAVSGATLSSRGLLAAVADAIIKAGGDPKDYGFVSANERTDSTEILFSGLPGGNFALTGAQLKNDFTLTERDAVSVNSKGTEKQVCAKGVLLETILQQRGLSQADFDSVTANATDGYAIAIPNSVLQKRDVLIAFEVNGEALEAPRIVIPDERAMYWTKLLCSMEFSGQTQEQPVTKTVSLNELVDRLRDRAEDYKYYDADCKALPVALLLQEIGAEKTTTVTITADDLTRMEKYDIFSAQMLLIEGTPEAPLYTGPTLLSGMKVKQVKSFQVGGILVKAD